MAVLVARPDAHPETSTFDGNATWADDVGDATWAEMRGADPGNFVDDTGVTLFCDIQAGTAGGSWYEMTRIIFGFNTASIPDDATITGAVLGVHTAAPATNDLAQSVNITTITAPASATAITDTDYAVTKYGSTKLSDDLALAATADDTAYEFTLNASGIAAISKTGITWLALRLVSDISNSEPMLNPGGFVTSNFTIHSAEAATEAHRPVLTVTYTEAAAEGGLPVTSNISVAAIARCGGRL